jgi:hypothetical protein
LLEVVVFSLNPSKRSVYFLKEKEALSFSVNKNICFTLRGEWFRLVIFISFFRHGSGYI